MTAHGKLSSAWLLPSPHSITPSSRLSQSLILLFLTTEFPDADQTIVNYWLVIFTRNSCNVFMWSSVHRFLILRYGHSLFGKSVFLSGEWNCSFVAERFLHFREQFENLISSVKCFACNLVSTVRMNDGGWLSMPRPCKATIKSFPIIILHHTAICSVGLLTTISPSRISASLFGTPPPMRPSSRNESSQTS